MVEHDGALERVVKKKCHTKPKERKSGVFWGCIGLVVALCFFNQFDVLFRNQAEFGVQPQEVLWGFLLFGLIVFTLAFCLLHFTDKYFGRFYWVVRAILVGIVLSGYAQVLFLNSHYNGAFEDFAGDYKPITGWIKAINIVIWLIIFLAPLFALLMQRRLNKQFCAKLFMLVSVVIFAMQSVGLAFAAPNADFRKYDKSFYFSVDKQLELSKSENENIVVFILDRAATGYVDEVFKRNPGLKENFDGFTYFRDNISEYAQTFPSVISMLTGKDFVESGSREEFSQQAWQNAQLFDLLKAQNYTVNGLLDALSTYYNLDEVEDKFDNIEYVTSERKVSQWNAVKNMTKVALHRSLPYLLKGMADFDYPNDLHDIVGVDTSSFFPNNISASSDTRFSQKVSGRGLTAQSETNTFSIVHLNCGHAFDWADATKETFVTLGKYFDQMKSLGIYQNSTIILSSDHGARGHGRGTALFIKRKGESGFDMKTDSATKLSNGFFLSTMFELIGESDKKTTPSYFDVIDKVDISDKDWDSNRYFYSTSWDVANKCTFEQIELIDNSIQG